MENQQATVTNLEAKLMASNLATDACVQMMLMLLQQELRIHGRNMLVGILMSYQSDVNSYLNQQIKDNVSGVDLVGNMSKYCRSILESFEHWCKLAMDEN